MGNLGATQELPVFVTPDELQATLWSAMSEPAVCVATYDDVLAAPENGNVRTERRALG